MEEIEVVLTADEAEVVYALASRAPAMGRLCEALAGVRTKIRAAVGSDHAYGEDFDGGVQAEVDRKFGGSQKQAS